MKNQKGFSLIELLVVVIIIGIIAAIAIPSLLNSRRAAQEAATVGSMRNFHTANTTYLTTETPNTFGATANALSAVKLIDDSFADAIDGGSLRSNYTWAYTYAATAPQAYTLTATGANGGYLKSYRVNEEGVIRWKTYDASNGNGQTPAATDAAIQ